MTHADREQTKKVVYAVVYGAGRCGGVGGLRHLEARRGGGACVEMRWSCGVVLGPWSSLCGSLGPVRVLLTW